MMGDWKSADEIEDDIRKGEAELPTLVLDLWRRVEELEAKLEAIQQQLAFAGSR